MEIVYHGTGQGVQAADPQTAFEHEIAGCPIEAEHVHAHEITRYTRTLQSFAPSPFFEDVFGAVKLATVFWFRGEH